MHVVEAADSLQASWDAFVAASPTGSFLQSWAWGEFQRAAGFHIERLLVRDGFGAEDIGAVCLLVHRALPLRRHYLYAPWGPVFRATDVASPGESSAVAPSMAELTGALRQRLRGGAVFARLELKVPPGAAMAHVLGVQGYLLTGRGIQPKDTLVLDLAKTEDELLVGMHPKTRYNIRLARRHGVCVVEQTDAEGLRVFLRLAAEVQRRGEFRYHPEPYYAAMLRVLRPAGMLTILTAEHQGQSLAAHLLLRFGGTVTYVHGASAEAKKHVMAPHLLQWEGILRAKAHGATRYDFFGIASPMPVAGGRKPVIGIWQPVSHPWFGITRFKKGFGGTAERYLGAADLVGDAALYRAYEIGRGLRGLLR